MLLISAVACQTYPEFEEEDGVVIGKVTKYLPVAYWMPLPCLFDGDEIILRDEIHPGIEIKIVSPEKWKGREFLIILNDQKFIEKYVESIEEIRNSKRKFVYLIKFSEPLLDVNEGDYIVDRKITEFSKI